MLMISIVRGALAAEKALRRRGAFVKRAREDSNL